MKIGALDLSTHTGWAFGPSDGEPAFGTLDLPKTGDDVGRFILAFDEWIRAMVAVETPEVLVFEAPIMTRGKTTLATARKLMGLASHVEFVCAQLSIRCSESNIGSIKLFFAGSGRADKSDMISVAHRYGWKARNDNEADALGLWASSVHHYAPAHARRFSLGPMGAKPRADTPAGWFGERAVSP
jgi:crossover junction endodeoxyribonuclease RuvC